MQSVTKMMEFIVVDTPSAYNTLLGRPILVGLGAITSVRHLAMKFPTPRGTGIIRGDYLAARECYNISTSGKGHAVAQTLVLIAELKVGETRAAAEAREVEDFDPRVGEEMADMEPVEELDEVYLDPNNQSKTIRIRKNLTEESR